MKITKTASGKQKLTLSKKDWQNIGKQAGWGIVPEEISEQIVVSDYEVGILEKETKKNPPVLDRINPYNNQRIPTFSTETYIPVILYVDIFEEQTEEQIKDAQEPELLKEKYPLKLRLYINFEPAQRGGLTDPSWDAYWDELGYETDSDNEYDKKLLEEIQKTKFLKDIEVLESYDFED